MDNITGIRSSSGAIVILPHYLDINAVTRFIDVYIAHQIDNLTIYTCDEPIECIMALNYDELLRCDSSTQRKLIDWQCKNNMPLFRIYSRMIIRSDDERAKVCAKYLDDLIDRMIDCINDASLASKGQVDSKPRHFYRDYRSI